MSLKWFVCLSEFEPLGPIKNLERQEVPHDLNYLIQIEVSQVLNQKSSVCMLHGTLHRRNQKFSPMGSFHRNDQGSVSVAVSGF